MSPARKPRCARCGKADLFGPAPVRTAAHPNSSAILVETPGSRFQDHPVQGTVCLACGEVSLSLSAPTLASLRGEVRRTRRGG